MGYSEFFDEMDGSHELAENKIENEPDKVKLWVEGDEDIPFWFAVFKTFAPKLKVEFIPYSSNANEEKKIKGKDFLLKQANENLEWVNYTKLICVDSDYDYLVSTTDYAKIINEKRPFIFQTYTYSIENYKCLAESLQYICVDVTYRYEQVFDFSQFLKEYSEIIYDLFVYSVYSKVENLKPPIRCRKKEIGLGNCWRINNNGDSSLEKLKEKIEKIIKQIHEEHAIDSNKINEIKEKLEKKGIVPQNVYLFVHGHTLFESVVSPILCKGVIPKLSGIQHKVITNKMTTNNSDNCKAGQIHQKYKKMKPNPMWLLNTNKAHFFLDCPLLGKIKHDVEEYLKVYDQNVISKG